MTLEQARSSLRWERTRVARTPRFRLKRTAHGGGYVDGAWWPRTDDVIAELPNPKPGNVSTVDTLLMISVKA
jgi:hypothetical protein